MKIFLILGMKVLWISFLVLGVALANNSESNADDLWSWIGGSEKQESVSESQKQIRHTESVDQVADNILQSSRQGRILQEYNQIYNDPEVQHAIQSGNDTTARHYIKDRLCNLGLMQVIKNKPLKKF